MPEPLHDWLRRKYPASTQTTLRNMIRDGRVRVNGVVAKRWGQPVEPGDKVVVNDRTKPARPTVAPLTLIHEDEDLIVVDKPPGLLTSTVPNEKRPTALAILNKYAGPVGLIHRLDRDASGLLVFTKTRPAYEALKTAFYQHDVIRIYSAVVHGKPTPADGRIISLLSERPDGTVKRSGRGQQAITDYKTIAHHAARSQLEVTLQTGRKHQIRVHLSDRGVPILGDKVYGKPDDADRMMLAAVKLGFIHPRTGQPAEFTIAPPWPAMN